MVFKCGWSSFSCLVRNIFQINKKEDNIKIFLDKVLIFVVSCINIDDFVKDINNNLFMKKNELNLIFFF